MLGSARYHALVSSGHQLLSSLSQNLLRRSVLSLKTSVIDIPTIHDKRMNKVIMIGT